MAIMSVFKTSTSAHSPLDGSGGSRGTGDTAIAGAGGPGGDGDRPGVSDFLTVQSFTNFAAMTGAITAAWHALQNFGPVDQNAIWVPYILALTWGLISFLISVPGLKTDGKMEIGNLLGALFVAFINSLVLAGAVVGTGLVTNPTL